MIKCENGVYLEMTPEEIEEYNKLPQIPQQKSILEEQILNLQKLMISQKISGGGITVLNDSSELPIKELKLSGKSEQFSTIGKNLFHGKILANKYPTDDMNIYEDKTTTNVFDKPVEIKPDTAYIISADGKLVEGNIYIYDEAGKKITEHFNGRFTSPSNAKYVLASGVDKYMSVNSAVQIEYGSTITTYEPYTGGKPSPSPEYPQEIKNVGKYNEDTGKYEVDVKLTGKNLFDNTAVFENGLFNYQTGLEADEKDYGRMKEYFPILPGLNYVFTVNGDSLITGIGISFLDERKNIIVGTNKAKFTSPENALYVRIRYKYWKPDDKVSLQYASIPYLTYEPYREQTVKLTSDRPITKWDKLVEQDGQIGWLYGSEIKKHTFTESTVFSNVSGENEYKAYVNDLRAFRYAELMCDSAVNSFLEYNNHVRIHFEIEERAMIMIPWSYLDGVNFSSTSEEQRNAIHKYLDGKTFNMIIQTQETEFVPLAEDEQKALKALKTYYPTTVIATDGGELDPDVEVSYIADTKNFILEQINAIKTAVVNTQAQLL